jgi:hypothetical protein
MNFDKLLILGPGYSFGPVNILFFFIIITLPLHSRDKTKKTLKMRTKPFSTISFAGVRVFVRLM